MDFAERDQCKAVLLRLSLARNLEKLVASLYGTEWRERGFRHGRPISQSSDGSMILSVEILSDFLSLNQL